MHHILKESWLKTSKDDPRGFIQPAKLTELWFHTGTACNLGCDFCLEGSKPGDHRIESLTLKDVVPFMNDAFDLDIEQFSFTGGEPFVNQEIIEILDYALALKPCLVLSNGTKPVEQKINELLILRDKPNQLKFRISLDYPNREKHDEGRGQGSFEKALHTIKYLYENGFGISIARRSEPDENTPEIEGLYRHLFTSAGLPSDTLIITFPELHSPGATIETPEITENCMITYKTEGEREKFMCNYSKMVAKKNGKARVYACTLVDDDDDYDLGDSLKESMKVRIMLKHHRCYACFSNGCSCSE